VDADTAAFHKISRWFDRHYAGAVSPEYNHAATAFWPDQRRQFQPPRALL